MMDIVKRLKAKPPKGFVTSPLMIEAADEIERLREENAKLKEEVDDLNNRLIEAAEMADYHD
jgi:cell division protein FtsB